MGLSMIATRHDMRSHDGERLADCNPSLANRRAAPACPIMV